MNERNNSTLCRTFFIILLVAVGMALMFGCNFDKIWEDVTQKNKSPKEVAPLSQPDKEKPVVPIGLISSRSGGAAAYGEDCYKGAQLALMDRKADLPFSPKIFEGDDRSKPADAQRLAMNMVNLNQIQVMFGPIISPSAIIAGKMFEEKGVPMVTPSATQDEVVMPKNGVPLKYVTQICFNDNFQGEALAKFTREELKLERMLIIYDQSISYSVGLANSFKRVFTELGGTIVGEEAYSVTDADFSALISKVARMKNEENAPQGLFIPGWDENVGPMLRQAGDSWKDYVLLGGDGWPTNNLLKLSGGNLHNTYSMAHFASDRSIPALEHFLARYQVEYKEKPSPHAALGFDAMNVILDAVTATVNDPTRENISKQIREMGTVDLLTGKATILANGGFTQKEGIIVKIEPTGFKFVKTIQP